MNTVYTATLQNVGCYNSHENISQTKKKKKKENFSKTRKSNFTVGRSEKEFFTLTCHRFYTYQTTGVGAGCPLMKIFKVN